MNLNQLTDAELKFRLNNLCSEYLASCPLDCDFEHLEQQLDDTYAEAKSRGHF